MTLQTEVSEKPADIMRKSNVVDLPATEVLRMVEDLRRALKASPERAPGLALEFLRRIASADATVSDAVHGGLAPWQVRKVDRYLKDNLERSIGLSELA